MLFIKGFQTGKNLIFVILREIRTVPDLIEGVCCLLNLGFIHGVMNHGVEIDVADGRFLGFWGELELSENLVIPGKGSGISDDEVDLTDVLQVFLQHGKNSKGELVVDDVDGAVSPGLQGGVDFIDQGVVQWNDASLLSLFHALNILPTTLRYQSIGK